MADTNTPVALSISGAAHLLGVSRATVYRLMDSGDISSLKIGTRRLISRDAISAFVNDMTEKNSNVA